MEVVELEVNRRKHRIEIDGARSLLSVLRDDLDLTGAKYGCGEGRCGACTVLVEGRAVRSCVTRAASVQRRPIVTIEGLEQGGRLHPLQEAFLELNALQCGYCTPGMIMAGVALLQQNARPTRAEIVRALDGNICRCGVYPRVIAALERSANGKHASRGER